MVTMLTRRNLLFLSGSSLLLAAKGKASPPRWDYEGNDPGLWSTLTDEYRACGSGTRQSPINLEHEITSRLPQLETEYNDRFLSVRNNGHTIMVTAAVGSRLLVEGKQFDLLQMHFHHPSEHQLRGIRYPAECHLVHHSAQYGTAVLAIMIEYGLANPCFEKILELTPEAHGGEVKIPSGLLDIATLIPDARHYIRYTGSLTTPPCTEGVTWFVLVKPVQFSQLQLSKFAGFYPNNARPVQPLNNRPVFKN